eukprot:TRINITY_DN23597_c0_g1_i1.p1 TRINITY_DN23597_c0_g1~~TRINITY_DN23597_c0_g1_i1.p1  ORF type:complete len:188 (+),score=30.51 TRINITY_DN23597_c0_g1_i1:56-565(+)
MAAAVVGCSPALRVGGLSVSHEAVCSSSSSVQFGRMGALAVRPLHSQAQQRRTVPQALAADVAEKIPTRREEQMAEIRVMTTEDIEAQVVDMKTELFFLRCKKARSPQEYKPSETQALRKKIARMLTVKREREIEQGISKRESRKMDYKWRKSIVPHPPPSYNPEDWLN